MPAGTLLANGQAMPAGRVVALADGSIAAASTVAPGAALAVVPATTVPGAAAPVGARGTTGKKRPAAPASPGPRVRQVSIEDDAPPTEPSLFLATAAAPMPIPSRREAGIAKQVSVDSEDEDDWGHFSFEDGDAPPSSLENYRWN